MKTIKLAKKVGRAIAGQRKQMGMTQLQVARALAMEIETVSRLENGAISATLERLEQFSQLFGCPVEAFFREESSEADQMARNITDLLGSLKLEERRLLLGFIQEAVKLFKKRAVK